MTHVSDRVLYDLLQAEKIGRNPLEEFVAERTESNKKSFYAPINFFQSTNKEGCEG